MKNEAEWIERQAAEGKIGISLDGTHAVNSITTHAGVTQKRLHPFLFATTAELKGSQESNETKVQ